MDFDFPGVLQISGFCIGFIGFYIELLNVLRGCVERL